MPIMEWMKQKLKCAFTRGLVFIDNTIVDTMENNWKSIRESDYTSPSRVSLFALSLDTQYTIWELELSWIKH